ncbi:hypothetical protein JXQ70_03610 [bacterium]|nr:hypothetical protein [bacterium]
MNRDRLLRFVGEILVTHMCICVLIGCRTQSERSVAQPVVTRTDRVPSDAKNSFSKTEFQYIEAIRELEQAIANHGGKINPTWEREFEHNLAIIDKSITDLKSVQEHNQNNNHTQDSLLFLYQKKVDLLHSKYRLLSNYQEWSTFLYQLMKM